MALTESAIANFNTMLKAAGDDNLALLECYDAVTGEVVPTVCAVSYDRKTKEYIFTPFAKLFTGNPYDEVNPPV